MNKIEAITVPAVRRFVFDGGTEIEFTGSIKKFLCANIKDGNIELFAETSPSCMRRAISIEIVRSGDEIPNGYSYISTVKDSGGDVIHIYAMLKHRNLWKGKCECVLSTT